MSVNMKKLRVSLLHVAPIVGEIEYNQRLIECAVQVAAERGADWVVSPELCLCGYQFSQRIGTDWIAPQPDAWMAQFCQLVKSLQISVFLAGPERDATTGKLHNSAFLVNSDGEIIGKHRKINVHAEASWASPGEAISAIAWNSLKVGLLICADAYTKDIAGSLKAQGAQLLVSPAAWAPGLYGPAGEWEQRTRDTGLPLIVCNRTGREETLSFVQAESVVVKQGKRVLAHHSTRSVVLTFDWDLETMDLLSPTYQKDDL
jgi:omega-amidase